MSITIIYLSILISSLYFNNIIAAPSSSSSSSSQQSSSSQYATSYLGLYPPGCNEDAALQCEYDFLNCRLFNGPADDPPTLCACGGVYFGDCIRKAGCTFANEVGALSLHEVYLKKCVDHIIKFDCEDTTMCAVNCASEGAANSSDIKIMPFNNYGNQFLRIRTCKRIIHTQNLEKYSFVDVVACKTIDDFNICNRFIPPSSFIPVIIPKDTTYIEVDYCNYNAYEDKYTCDTKNPTRLFGNKYNFPRTFDVPSIKDLYCKADTDCLGSFCDYKFRPPKCSPKTMRHVLESGATYMSDPFGG